jgi:hypothetical protein
MYRNTIPFVDALFGFAWLTCRVMSWYLVLFKAIQMHAGYFPVFP